MAASLRTQLGYTFRQPDLLRQALTHRSARSSHNERLEFVGDAVLNCVIGVALFERFRALPEGDLSRVRAALVNQDTLARVARTLGLGKEIELGEGELKSGGADRPSILADALEAVFGAVFLDGGFDAARAAIVTCFGEVLSEADPAALAKDPKTRLQEWLQGRGHPLPAYTVLEVSGEPHEQSFRVRCDVPGLGLAAVADGSSRRRAEQEAAQRILEDPALKSER